jgi:serine/threonine protein phosphatase 1
MITVAAVGDIHGRVDKLRSAISWLRRSNRHVVFLGDYINRGPDSFATLQLLIEFNQYCQNGVTFLRGNHEASLLRLLDGGDNSSFLRHGGLTTVRSYTQDRSVGVLKRFVGSFPQDHHNFLTETTLYYEDSDWLLSHAGFDPAHPERRDELTMVGGDRASTLFGMLDVRHVLHKQVVFGHYVQMSGRPYVRGGINCIDTGCGTLPTGKLTVLLLPELVYEQF